MVNPKRIEAAKQAREYRETNGAKFMRANFDAPIMEFLNCDKPAAYLRGANGIGKTWTAAWLITAILLDRWPTWYRGWKPRPREDAYAVTVIVMSQSAQVLRDAMQLHLLGDVAGGMAGTGMIPKDRIVSIQTSRGIAGAVDFAVIRRDDGTLAQIFFRSYEQGRVSIQGIRANGGIFCDELFNDPDLLGEILGRFSGVGGVLRVTATERFQSTDLAQWFYDNPGERPIFGVSMDDIKRISEEDKKAFLANLPEAERAARYYGERFSGGGNVWQTPIDHILCELPPHLHEVDTKYMVSLDWNHFGAQGSFFAALFWAMPARYSGTVYLFDEILMRGSINDQAGALLSHGARGIPIAWPHDGQQGQADGSSIIRMFKQFDGLKFHNTWATMHADPSAGYNRASGIKLANHMLGSGLIKVSYDLVEFRKQYVRYEYDDKGLPLAKNDDLMSSFRVGCMMTKIARPIDNDFGRGGQTKRTRVPTEWDPFTGQPIGADHG